MPEMFERASEAAEVIRKAWGGPAAEAAIVLGSGLDAVASRLTDGVALAYEEIPHFPRTTVAGHSGQLWLGRLGRLPVVMLRGRFHSYEGHDLEAVTFPVRVLQRLGVPRLILTAATGGIRGDLAPGSIVCLEDHINALGQNPLRGPNDERFGPRFPDLSEVYSRELRTLAADTAASLGQELATGVYACVPGPSYETPAEVRALRVLGADVVGMSTVPEAVVARHGGQLVLGLVVVSNWAAGLGGSLLSHAEVLEAGREASGRLADLLEGICARLASRSA